MADELRDPELTQDEELMLEVGWLDLWHSALEGDPDEVGAD
jgi:hypothetical protein